MNNPVATSVSLLFRFHTNICLPNPFHITYCQESCYIMNGASDENIENRIGEENEENEQFLRQKVQRKRRPHALAYRDTNISGAIREKHLCINFWKIAAREKKEARNLPSAFMFLFIDQRYQEPPTKNRWLPTGTSAFT
ncbi:hypothetical protein X798_07328, partial [Onchocerca flexuosa]